MSRILRVGMSTLPFEKYEGLGNDFIVVESRDEGLVSPSVAARLCDRHFGVGADGVLLVLPPRERAHLARMRVLNADGSMPEMCGNGLRCVALHVARTRGVHEGTYETDAGTRFCRVDGLFGAGAKITVDMGKVAWTGDRAIDIDGAKLVVSTADAGNPHAVAFGETSRAEIERLGPRVAEHPAFDGGTNVEFATLRDGRIDLVVWERGVGLTLACGTGACATVAVACEKGLLPFGAPVVVRLPGGDLEVTIARGDEACRALMRGAAHHVFSGRFNHEPSA